MRVQVPEATGGTSSSERVADILLLFSDGPRTIGVTRAARELGLSKAVVHRILQSLTGRGLVAYDAASREYGLGPAAASLGSRALRDSDLRAVALPHLVDLRDRLHETATVSAKVPGGRLFLDQVVGAHEITMSVEVGRRLPLHAGAVGKCILAFSTPDEIDLALSRDLRAVTQATVVDPDRLRAELARIRADGHAASVGEREAGAASVAAPVLGRADVVVGAVSVCGPRFRLTDERIAAVVPDVVAAAALVTDALAGRATPGGPRRPAGPDSATGRSPLDRDGQSLTF
ncbi:IclR family transcriptional regulator [Pseudonocardia dioxanivorans]|uniref:IclR family transcriptional regulator n=1 Tax=Pseudonocardia dioxanivorans TaxID=240495 RepID=UPI000CD168DA|nr:IclR family transcriptional regulator [Pseudonocardia dioxanivorans]